ncbi:hypothetical protein MPH_10079 [Macrophomina phaseolina MS6]|uniref:Uncharacterized protein n=1 Tax=Macrophomina phaseolina (strain MS6) TaxID=1126212 RepID=K2QSI5_MACPH|nr:hypothetical protein MPH_10079 [Macrophomina phaseolina MS6]
MAPPPLPSASQDISFVKKQQPRPHTRNKGGTPTMEEPENRRRSNRTAGNEETGCGSALSVRPVYHDQCYPYIRSAPNKNFMCASHPSFSICLAHAPRFCFAIQAEQIQQKKGPVERKKNTKMVERSLSAYHDSCPQPTLSELWAAN